MPAPVEDLFAPPTQAKVRVALEPVPNGLYSIHLLSKADHFSGLGEWLMHTHASLTPEQRHRNRLITIGFHFAFIPTRSWASFPAYLDHLASLKPQALVNRLMTAYTLMAEGAATDCHFFPEQTISPAAWQPALKSPDAYLDFLKTGFPAHSIDEAVELEAYQYLQDPPALQRLMVSHLTEMWDEYLAAEWQRERPILKDAVRAFQHHDLTSIGRLEAARLVTGQDLKEADWGALLDNAQQVIFVPSLQIGPYVGKMISGTTLWMIYGARLPEGTSIHAPDLSRAEILVRLGALADDTRLRILQLIGEAGELRSQDIMQRLDLSQSAASRHLAQLSATGYLTERRCDGAKCFALNPEKIGETLQGVKAFLHANLPVTR